MSNQGEVEPRDQFGNGMQELNQTPCGSQVLQARVEEVIKEFNLDMELSEERMERLRTTVMNEAKAVVAKLEEAEASRKEELGRKNEPVDFEKLTNDLGVMGQQEG